MADQLNAFTDSEFRLVAELVASDTARQADADQRLILVGGQSIAVWGRLHGVPPPSPAALTADVDWLGSGADAQRLGEQLKQQGFEVTVSTPAQWDATSNSALVQLRQGGRYLLMDFLWGILGPSVADIRRKAVPTGVHGASVHVLHPLHGLESRLSNLEKLDTKRRGNGVEQATWMLAITSAHLQRLVQQGQPRDELARQCRFLAQLAEYKKCGKFCFLHYGFDASACVSEAVAAYIGPKFQDLEWASTRKRIAKKQADWLAYEAREQQHIKQPRSE